MGQHGRAGARRAAGGIALRALIAWLALGCGGSSDDKDESAGGASSKEPPNASSRAGSSAADGDPGPRGGTGGGLAAELPADAGKPSANHPDAGGDAATDAGADAGAPAAGIDCAPRAIAGDATMHFHHVHFNTVDADQDLEFFEKLFGTQTIEWCKDKTTGAATWATKTDRGYFLFTEVEKAPDPALNTYLEHVGWIHPMPNMELMRLFALSAPLWPENRFQCAEAIAGTMACGFDGYWFYLQAPSGARIEVAKGPGPATMGFGHVHMIMGVDFTWLETVTNGAYHDGAIDLVNHTAVSLEESILMNETVTETRGKPIDHIAYSTTMLEAERDRIVAAGITPAEDISYKPEFGFRSFMLKDSKGIWYEIVEDAPFAP